MMELAFRTLTPTDGPALRSLFGTPDMGHFRVARVFHHDPLAVLDVLGERPGGVVATTRDRVIAALLIRRAPVQWNGACRKGVFVGNVTVHPDFRRRGIAMELQRQSLQLYAEDCDQAVIYGSFQESNEASLAMVRENLSYRTESVFGGIFHRRWLPVRSRGLMIREARSEDLPRLAKRMNAYFGEHQLWTPVSAESLAESLARELSDHRPHRLFVALRSGVPVAGVTLRDATPLEQMRLFGLGLRPRLLGQLAGVFDREGYLRTVRAHSLWFERGEEQAAEILIDTLRYRWRRRGAISSLVHPLDRAARLVRNRIRMNQTQICHMTNDAADAPGARPIFKS